MAFGIFSSRAARYRRTGRGAHLPDVPPCRRGNTAVRDSVGIPGRAITHAGRRSVGGRSNHTILQALGVLDPQGNPTARLEAVKQADVARLTQEDWQKERDRNDRRLRSSATREILYERNSRRATR